MEKCPILYSQKNIYNLTEVCKKFFFLLLSPAITSIKIYLAPDVITGSFSTLTLSCASSDGHQSSMTMLFIPVIDTIDVAAST